MRFTMMIGLCVLALFAQNSNAQDKDFTAVEIKAEKVSKNVYMLTGRGGNIAAIVGEDGTAIVDDQFAPLAPKIEKALKDLGATDKPVRFVINTHFHGDHVGGNLHFSKTATIVAHDNVRKRLRDGRKTGERIVEPAPKDALPVITFEHGMTLHINGEEIRVMHLPMSHTDGDSLVYFKNANVIHMGDTYFSSGFPFIDVGSGGSLNGTIEGLKKVLKSFPQDVILIAGHGKISKLSDLETTVKMLEDTRRVVLEAKMKGMNLEQMKREKILEPWEEYSWDFITTDKYLTMVYGSLEPMK